MEFQNIKLPLSAEDSSRYIKALVVDTEGSIVAEIASRAIDAEEEENRLAQVFAAAPDLLEALEMVLPYLKRLRTIYFIDDSIEPEKFSPIAKACNMAESAIAKAYGKTKD